MPPQCSSFRSSTEPLGHINYKLMSSKLWTVIYSHGVTFFSWFSNLCSGCFSWYGRLWSWGRPCRTSVLGMKALPVACAIDGKIEMPCKQKVNHSRRSDTVNIYLPGDIQHSNKHNISLSHTHTQCSYWYLCFCYEKQFPTTWRNLPVWRPHNQLVYIFLVALNLFRCQNIFCHITTDAEIYFHSLEECLY